MSVQRPKFIDSPYFIPDDENWHLKENAPPEVVEEFEQFMEEYDRQKQEGRLI